MPTKQKIPAPAGCRDGEDRQAAGECTAGRGWLLADGLGGLHALVGPDGRRGEAVVLPPGGQGGGHRQTGGDQAF